MVNLPNSDDDRPSEPAGDPFARSGRERASLVERGYFHRANRLERWKRRMPWVGLLAPLLPLGIAWAMPHGDGIYSRGPVAGVHAAWDDRCGACHEPFRPVNANTWFSKAIGTAPEGRWRNHLCESCHAAPVHRESEKESSVVNCGGCHREHQGRETSLTRLHDTDCTRCHSELASHRKDGRTPEFAERVSGFAKDHPEFRLLDKGHADHFKPQSRTLKFSHALHMAAGQDVTGASKRPPMTYGKLPNVQERARYWALDAANKGGRDAASPRPDALVSLNCAACHQLDGGDAARTESTQTGTLPKRALNPARADGAYMLPVNFETHCKACHPLDDFGPRPVIDKAALEAPHRLEPDDMEAFLRRSFTQHVLEARGIDLKKVPFNPFGRLDKPETKEGRSAQDEVDDLVGRAKRDLYASGRTCAKCHEVSDDGKSRSIPAVSTPAIWFKHAKFNHASHRSMDCKSCHKGAYAAPPGPGEAPGQKLVEKEPLLIEGVKSCQECHAPASTAADGSPRGGVRSNCTDCHLYHNRDHALQGLGAKPRDPMTKLTLEELLRGDKKIPKR